MCGTVSIDILDESLMGGYEISDMYTDITPSDWPIIHPTWAASAGLEGFALADNCRVKVLIYFVVKLDIMSVNFLIVRFSVRKDLARDDPQ